MAETQVRGLYGIHDVRILDRTDYSSLGYYRCLGTVNLEFSGEFAELKGGSNLFNWSATINNFSSTGSIVARELTSDILYSSLGQGTRTETAADTAGDVVNTANKKGTSVIAATGLASVTVKAASKANLKEGWYMIKASDATHILVYSLSSSNFNRGTNASYVNDDGLITSVSVTIATGAGSDLDGFGLTFTGGAGAIGFTPNDTAIFYVKKPHGGWYEQVVGELPMEFPEVAINIVSETESGVQTNILLYRVKLAGTSIPFEEKGYGELNIPMAIMHDSTENAVCTIRRTSLDES